MADNPASNFVEPAEPPVHVDSVESQNDVEIFDSPDIDKIPTHETKEVADEPAPQPEPAQPTPEKADEPTPSNKEPQPEKSEPRQPLFETEKPSDAPFKSKEADEIRKSPPPAILKGKAAESFNVAKEKWAGIVEAKDHQLNKLEKTHQTEVASLAQKNKELEEQISRLSGYESVIDFQSTDKFKKDFEEPITKAEEALINYYSSLRGVTQEGIDELKRGVKDDGYLFNAIAELDKTAPNVASRFRFEVQKLQDLKTRRDMALEDVKSNHQKFVEQRRVESTTKAAEFDNGVKQSLTNYVQAMGEDKRPAYPFLVKMKAPEGADAAMIDQVNKHNQFVERNIADLNAAVKSENPQDRVKFVVGYMTAVVQANVIKDLSAKLTEANEYISRVKKASAPPSSSGGGGHANVSPSGDDIMAQFDREHGR